MIGKDVTKDSVIISFENKESFDVFMKSVFYCFSHYMGKVQENKDVAGDFHETNLL